MKCLICLAIAVLASACAKPLEPTPIKPTPPPSTAPASIQVLAASRSDQRVDLSALVRTVEGNPVPEVSVTFSASAGTLSPDIATTDSAGYARVILTPQTQQTMVRAETNGISSSLSVLAVPAPAPPNPTPPAPNPTPPDPTLPLTVSINVGSGTVGQALQFGLSTQAMSRADWTFGDGSSATTTTGSVSHTYNAAGSYPVGVTVTDVRGRTASATKTVRIDPEPPPPAPGLNVTLTPDRSSVPVGGTVFYTATISNLQPGETVTAYQWDLDGNGQAEFISTTPFHNSNPYTTAGFVTATVTVKTNMRTGVGSTTIVVTN